MDVFIVKTDRRVHGQYILAKSLGSKIAARPPPGILGGEILFSGINICGKKMKLYCVQMRKQIDLGNASSPGPESCQEWEKALVQ